MSDTAIKLDILTPMGAIRDGIDVPGVEVPGVLGELGILPRHESLITAIVPGGPLPRGRQRRQAGGRLRLRRGQGSRPRDHLVRPRGRSRRRRQERGAEPPVRGPHRASKRERGPIDAAEFRALQDERAWLEAQLRL
ncbi:MAG: hypothetical protein U0168_05945 [Nannocystaceae bacterium]